MAGGGATVALNTVLVSVGCYLLLLARSCHPKSTLLWGEVVNDWDDGLPLLLMSENGLFKLQCLYVGKPRTIFEANYYLGIWRNNQDGGSPVWIANRNSPFQLGSKALTIDSNGSFMIMQHHTDTGSEAEPFIIYEHDHSATNNDSYNTSATLEDSGNLVLYQLNADGSRKQILWQSFDYPTDTLLPGMKIGIDHRTGRNWSLTSPRSTLSAAVGSFTFGMDPNATTQLVIWQRGRVFWRSGAWENGAFPGSFPYEGYNFSYVTNENQTYFYYMLDRAISLFPMLRIDSDGRIIGTMTGLWFRGCDYQGYSIGDVYDLYEFGCVPRELPECRITPKFNLGFIDHWGFMSSRGFRYSETENLTRKDCEEICISRCSCAAYAPANDDGSGCEIWNSTFSFTALPTYDDGKTIYFIDQKNGWWLWVTLALGLAIIVPAFVGICYMAWIKFRHGGDRKVNLKNLFGIIDEDALHNTSNGTAEKKQEDENELQMFNFETIAAATNYFSVTNKLGQGGFGPVYKGMLVNGREIAVKRLSKSSGQGFLEFRNEVVLIAKLQHTNLVRLLGLCMLGDENILVYEYMPNKSLDFVLFDSERKSALDWKNRVDIIEGIAQGLLYLHKYSRVRVIHRDLKASNVLLDDDLKPKISDFGMARILCLRESEANTKRVVGTYGYMSPEYAMHGVVSTKIDVFSFGVLLLEIVSGRKNNGFYHPDQPVTLIGYAWQLWKEGQGLQLLEQALTDFSTQNVLRCIHIGLLCVQDQATDRPAMSEVVAMLSNDTLELPDPKQPAFFISAVEQEVDGVQINDPNCSKNTITISVMEAR